jgi:hypothetical protein
LQFGKWSGVRGFEALPMLYQDTDFKSNQQLSKITNKIKRLILANSLANS